MDMPENSVAARLIEHFGGRAEAGRALGRTAEAMRLWLLEGIPLTAALEVEESTAGLIKAEEILQEARARSSEHPADRQDSAA